MSVLNELTEEQRNLLISLPYRVGLWVSNSDTRGGDDSDEQELQTLSNLLHGIAEGVFGAETVQHIISATIANHDMWPQWSGDLDLVLDDCEHGVGVLRGRVDKKEVDAFRQHLYEVGEAVALSFSEYNADMDPSDRLKMQFLYLRQLIVAKIYGRPPKPKDEFFSISLEERVALSRLARTLQLQKG